MYTGPIPKSVNENFPDHTNELITCLLNGEQKQIIQSRYLVKLGVTKEQYLSQFPGAPLLSNSVLQSYKTASNSQEGKKKRSDTMKKLNLENMEFQEKRQQGFKNFLDSAASIEYRQAASEKAKNQHKNGLDEFVRKYFKERYQGSKDQTNRRDRMLILKVSARPEVKKKVKNTYIKNSELGIHNRESKYKKKKFKNTDLIYQSSFELDFLELCERNGVLSRVKNSPCFSDNDYPYNFYEPDYIFDNYYVIEIKSWYIEKLQNIKHPGLLQKKKNLVISKGYKFIYIKDKDYTMFNNLIHISDLGRST